MLSIPFNNNLPHTFLRFNTDKDRFVCSVCNFHGRKRSTVLAHVKVAHRRELNAAVSNNTKLEETPDCGKGMCKKLCTYSSHVFTNPEFSIYNSFWEKKQDCLFYKKVSIL